MPCPLKMLFYSMQKCHQFSMPKLQIQKYNRRLEAIRYKEMIKNNKESDEFVMIIKRW